MSLGMVPHTPRAVVSWSGGKDCMLALWEAREEFDITALLATVTAKFGRISMHGVRTSLLERQARALGLPLEQVAINYPCGNDEYETKMRAAYARHQAAGVHKVICGDIFLEDVRRYREENLFGASGCVFPLWQKKTSELAARFLDLGFEATVCCVDTTALPSRFTGRRYDRAFLADLPQGVDPCGENGEFHTFVHAGPLFSKPVRVVPGDVVLRENRFCYCELFPG